MLLTRIAALSMAACVTIACQKKTTQELEIVLENTYSDSTTAFRELEKEIIYRSLDSLNREPDFIVYTDSITHLSDTLLWCTNVQCKVSKHESLQDFPLDTLIKTYYAMELTIYIRDNRKDWMECNDNEKQLAIKSVCLVRRDSMERRTDGKFQLKGRKLEEVMNLCPKERFRDQIVTGICSGFAVSETTIVTAGHCIPANEDLSGFYFIFNFRQEENATRTVFEANEVYVGIKVIERQADEISRNDFAVITVDHPIPREHIVELRESDVTLREPLIVVGHPCGLPVKFADEASVIDISNSNVFLANLDAFKGNSGSPVFDSNHHVVGFLTQGAQDFHRKIIDDCLYSNICYTYGTESCEGERVCRTSQFFSHLRYPVAGAHINQ